MIGSLAAALGGVDALVFTAGIGENSPTVRANICDGLEWMGIEIDATKNNAGGEIGAGDVRVITMATDEERVIARAAIDALNTS